MKRELGQSGVAASHIGLGCVTFGREITEDAAFALMDYAVDHGITLFDTAEAYGGGQARAYRQQQLGVNDAREVSDEMHSSEKIVGRWLRSRKMRDRITLVTKITRDFRRVAVRTALEASLARLQTDHVDLYLYHAFDPTTALEEAAAAMDAVIRAGLSRAGGLGNHSGAQLEAALEISHRNGLKRFEAVELGYNLLTNRPDALPVATRKNLGVLAYSPLAAGFLSGKYSPDRASIPKGTRFDIIPGHIDIYFTERNFRRLRLLHDLAGRSGVSALQIALAWVFQNPEITTVLVGARTEAHLANALAAEQLIFPASWRNEIESWDDVIAPEP